LSPILGNEWGKVEKEAWFRKDGEKAAKRFPSETSVPHKTTNRGKGLNQLQGTREGNATLGGVLNKKGKKNSNPGGKEQEKSISRGLRRHSAGNWEKPRKRTLASMRTGGEYTHRKNSDFSYGAPRKAPNPGRVNKGFSQKRPGRQWLPSHRTR